MDDPRTPEDRGWRPIDGRIPESPAKSTWRWNSLKGFAVAVGAHLVLIALIVIVWRLVMPPVEPNEQPNFIRLSAPPPSTKAKSVVPPSKSAPASQPNTSPTPQPQPFSPDQSTVNSAAQGAAASKSGVGGTPTTNVGGAGTPLKGGSTDPRIWAPLAPTPADLAAALKLGNGADPWAGMADSVAKDANQLRTTRDWVIRGSDGKIWGVTSDGRIHLGAITLPNVIALAPSAGKRNEYQASANLVKDHLAHDHLTTAGKSLQSQEDEIAARLRRQQELTHPVIKP